MKCEADGTIAADIISAYSSTVGYPEKDFCHSTLLFQRS
jgi:hypothetical protein